MTLWFHSSLRYKSVTTTKPSESETLDEIEKETLKDLLGLFQSELRSEKTNGFAIGISFVIHLTFRSLRIPGHLPGVWCVVCQVPGMTKGHPLAPALRSLQSPTGVSRTLISGLASFFIRVARSFVGARHRLIENRLITADI